MRKGASKPLAGPGERLTQRAHEALGTAVFAGAFAVDATAGNGHDTAFLAERVGEDGRVLAFDVQREALAATAERLERAGLRARVELVLEDHARLAERFAGRAIHAAAFNLGYLPGAAREVVTRPESTRLALRAALEHLAPAGVVTVLAYTGHAGGRAEAAAVLRVARALDRSRFDFAVERASRARRAPFLVIFRRCA